MSRKPTSLGTNVAMLVHASVRPSWMLIASMAGSALRPGSTSPSRGVVTHCPEQGTHFSPGIAGYGADTSTCGRGSNTTFTAPWRFFLCNTWEGGAGLRRAVALLLEHVVGVRRALQRQPVGDEVVEVQRIRGVLDERDEVVEPPHHVRLSHVQGDLFVEELVQRECLHRTGVDAEDRDRPAAPHGIDRVPERDHARGLHLRGL